MKMRFGALDGLCKLQVFFGWLIIAGAFGFLFFSTSQPLLVFDRGAVAMLALITVGRVFLGLQVIAMAQVCQCLMQIEINTRKTE